MKYLILLTCLILFACTKTNPPATVPPTIAIQYKAIVNKIDAGEKLYIFYGNSEDSTTLTTWSYSTSYTGHGTASVTARIRIPGTNNFTTPTNDTVRVEILSNNVVEANGVCGQSGNLNINAVYNY